MLGTLESDFILYFLKVILIVLKIQANDWEQIPAKNNQQQ